MLNEPVQKLVNFFCRNHSAEFLQVHDVTGAAGLLHHMSKIVRNFALFQYCIPGPFELVHQHLVGNGMQHVADRLKRMHPVEFVVEMLAVFQHKDQQIVFEPCRGIVNLRTVQVQMLFDFAVTRAFSRSRNQHEQFQVAFAETAQHAVKPVKGQEPADDSLRSALRGHSSTSHKRAVLSGVNVS